jgi:hypothetical protein
MPDVRIGRDHDRTHFGQIQASMEHGDCPGQVGQGSVDLQQGGKAGKHVL